MNKHRSISGRTITVSGKNIEYTLRRSRRVKSMRLTIYGDGTLVATMPHWLGVWQLEKFIVAKARWIFEKLSAPRRKRLLATGSRKDYLRQKNDARRFIEAKIAELNFEYGFDHGRIFIRDQRTRWGSCSKKGNLNFNYKILLLPERLADYIIVHELCHLGEFNHSAKFWKLVEKTIPDYKALRKALRKF